MNFDDFEKKLKDQFKGCHVDIQLYPSGGRLMVSGCAECGGNSDILESKIWRYDGGSDFDFSKDLPKTMDECINEIRKRLNQQK